MAQIGFVTTGNVTDTSYDWSIPAYTGRVARSCSVEVETNTTPAQTAATAFTQNGELIFELGSGQSTSIGVGSSAGTIVCTHKINASQVQFYADYVHPAFNIIPIQFVNYNTVPSVQATHTESSETDRTLHTINFTGDPLRSGSVILAITYSYDQNTYAFARTNAVQCFSGSGAGLVTSSVQTVTQAAAGAEISVSPTNESVSAKAHTGFVQVTTNASGWDFVD